MKTKDTKPKKNFPSIVGVIIVIIGLIIYTSSAIYDEKVQEYLIRIMPVSVVLMIISIFLNFIIPTQVIRVLTRMGIIFFFFYLIFYFVSKNLDEISSYFIALIFCGPILITTFMFQNRAIKREEKESLKRNWYLIDDPLYFLENGGMTIKRNNNFVIKDFVEVIFVDKNYKKIDGPFDQIDFYEKELRRVKKMGKFGFINNKTGEIIIEPKFDHASDFWKGISSVRIGEKVFLINTEGEVVPHSD